MKIFYFVLVIIIAIFFYIFSGHKRNSNLNLTTLENIEKQESINEPVSTIHPINEVPKAIPENHTFDQIKTIMKDIRNIKYKENITLNSRIDSFIYTKKDKEQFKHALASSFDIKNDKIEKNYKKNKLVWDWVNYLNDP